MDTKSRCHDSTLRIGLAAAAFFAVGLAGCNSDPLPQHIDGGTTKEAIANADAPTPASTTGEAGRGTAFVDLKPKSADTDEPKRAPSFNEVPNEGPPPGGLDAAVLQGLDPSQAQALIRDPGKTAKGAIEGLITFADLSLVSVSLDHLYDYMYKHESDNAKAFRFPERALAQEGSQKAIVGYMIALETKPRSKEVLEFMLVKDLLSCCYGQVPRPDEWVYVTMRNDDSVKYHMYRPIIVRGDFKVGRIDDSYGYSWGVYEMKADSVEIFTPPTAKD